MNPSTHFVRSGQAPSTHFARSRSAKAIAAALLIVPAVMFVAGCSRPPEQQFLSQFFRAARGRDNTTVGRMSAVEIDPRTQGTIEDFSIENISEETRTPLTFKPLFEAEAKAREEERAFLKTKIEYQNANIKAIEEVLKLEAQPDAKFTPAQQKIKAEWDKWREGIARHARLSSAATAAIKRATSVAEASLTQPGQPALDPKTFEGETIRKDVTVKAQFKSPEGQTSEKTLVITLERVAGGGREGRPIITKISGL
ncbi:MAG TPA: hypothetical protein VEC39_18860 [Vicinamibacterales bacterium]|nr:hypothetical protein [Vicinamibacterales bacterium]